MGYTWLMEVQNLKDCILGEDLPQCTRPEAAISSGRAGQSEGCVQLLTSHCGSGISALCSGAQRAMTLNAYVASGNQIQLQPYLFIFHVIGSHGKVEKVRHGLCNHSSL